jgi:hypothetical protein
MDAATNPPVSAAESSLETVLARMRRAFAIAAEPSFAALLAERRHLDDRPAPAALRALLVGLAPFRMGLQMAFSLEAGKPTLVWWMSEVGVDGRPEQAGEKAESLLTTAGLVASPPEAGPRGRQLRRFQKRVDGMLLEVEIEGFQRFVGGNKPACGAAVMARAVAGQQVDIPTLAQVLASLPELQDHRVPRTLLAPFAIQPVSGLALGGTWRRYYDLDITFAPGSPEAASALRGRLERHLGSEGFARQDEDRGVVTYQKSGSFAFLSVEGDKRDQVRHRIQPES